MSNHIMLQCGGMPASFEDICNVEPPEATDTYCPVMHGDLVRLVEDEMKARFSLSKPEMQFGLNREGKQMFGSLTYNMVEQDQSVDLSAFTSIEHVGNSFNDYGFSIVMRNAYDKSMSVGLAGGTKTFICDNMAITGNSFTIMRRHTKNVWDDVVPMVMQKVRGVADEYRKTVIFQESMKEKLIKQDRGYEIIGLARGRGVLTSNQMGVALDEWRLSRRKDHNFYDHRDNAYGLYNAFTHGLKLGHVGRKIDEYTGASTLFTELGLTRIDDAEIN